MLTVLHASDLQCGRPFLSYAAEALVLLAQQATPDVIVLSGDLTQRAKDSEFRAAQALMERLPSVPIVVTPGNHDVPLYRVWERLATPFRNWQRVISRELDSVTSLPGGTFVALNSAAPRRAIVNGRLDQHQIEFAQREFNNAPPSNVRALVVHHHFAPTTDGSGGSPLPGAKAHVRAFESMGADLVLSGHVHQTHVTTSRDLLPGAKEPGIPLITCGTTTSVRGRGVEEGFNSLNLVRVDLGEVEVLPHILEPSTSEFKPTASIILPRRVTGDRSTRTSDVIQ